MTYKALARELRLAKGTADNIVRDLVMVGHVEANRKAEVVKSLYESEEDAGRVILDYCLSHVLYRAFVSEIGLGVTFPEDLTRSIAKRVLTASSLSDRLLEHYRQKLLRWFLATGLIEREGREYVLRHRTNPVGLLDTTAVAKQRRGASLFLAEAPPARAIGALRAAIVERCSRENLEALHGRNSFSVLMSLNLVHPSGELVLRPGQTSGNPADDVCTAALHTATVVFTQELLRSAPGLNGEQVGEALAARFACEWSAGSKRRYGSALRQWALWASGKKLESQAQSRSKGAARTAYQTSDLFARSSETSE